MNIEHYHILGITSAEAIYKVCWQLNQLMDIRLAIQNTTNQNPQPLLYSSESSLSDLHYYLVANKVETENGLIAYIKSLKMVDYFLLIPRQLEEDVVRIINLIREAKIQVMNIPVASINHKDWSRIDFDRINGMS